MRCHVDCNKLYVIHIIIVEFVCHPNDIQNAYSVPIKVSYFYLCLSIFRQTKEKQFSFSFSQVTWIKIDNECVTMIIVICNITNSLNDHAGYRKLIFFLVLFAYPFFPYPFSKLKLPLMKEVIAKDKNNFFFYSMHGNFRKWLTNPPLFLYLE